jgi:hypothetical protein
MTRHDPNPGRERVYQGDILRDVEYIESVQEQAGIIEIKKVLFPLAVVLTQDCDLEWDYKFRTEPQITQDKQLISVLLAPMYNAEHFFQGNHLSEIDIASRVFGRKEQPSVKQKNIARYHYLDFPVEVGLVPCVIDFKHYFSSTVIYLEKLKKTAFICKVAELYREDISHRFASFLSRIGLPPEPQRQGGEPVPG